MGQTLRKKIFLAYALPVLVSLLVLAGMCYGFIRQSIDSNQQEKLVILAADFSHRIEAKLQDRMAIMDRVETLDFAHNFRELALSSHLAKFARPLPVLSYLNQQGEEEVKVVHGRKNDQLLSFATEPWFARALARKNEVVIGHIGNSPELNQPCLTLAIAHFSYFGDEFEGVLKGEIPLADLTAELHKLAPGRSGHGILVDDRGRVLFPHDPQQPFRPLQGNAALLALLGEDAPAHSGVGLVQLAGAGALVARASVPSTGWSVLAVLPYAEFISPSLSLAGYTLGTLLLALALGLLLAHTIARPLARNLSKVIDHTVVIAAGTLDLNLEIHSGDELESLATSLNQMSSSIRQALAARDSRQNILQTIIDPLVILDHQFALLEVNAAARHLLGRDRSALVGVPITTFLGASTAEGELLLAEIQRRGTLQNRETRLRVSSGTTVPVLLSCSTPDPAVNREIGLVAIFKDISALKQAEEERRQALLFVETLLNRSPLGIRVFDGVTGACVRVNPVAAAISGGSENALLAQNFRELQSWHETGLSGEAEAVLGDGVPRQRETNLTTSFGKTMDARYFFSRFLVEGHPHLLVISQDISEEKRLLDENRRIEEQMLHVQKLESLGVLAGGIAHDFNNILMTVIGNADLALMRLPAESPAVNNLKQIGEAAGKAADLAGQMLAYSGRGKFVIESIDLNRLIETMMHMLEVSITKKAVLRFDFSQQLPAVEGDATQLRQVIMNLVINASEAIGERSGVIAISTGAMDCDHSYLRDTWLDEGLAAGLYVFFEIADTGCGMDQETIQRIFDPFFSTKFTGRGLGMAAVLGIVRGHKGAIKVYSEPGQGTTFKVLLPACALPPETGQEDTPVEEWQGSGQVLLVDDEETVRAVGKMMLQELGYEVITAADGREALELFKAHREEIVLVLMDLTMPHMGGEDAFRELRRLDPQLKVIITSGYNEQEVALRFVGKGLTGFLQKPFRLAVLRETLRSVGPG
ncbi:hypothetical protein JCM30471_22310 [Desulfuromonas carbonis]